MSSSGSLVYVQVSHNQIFTNNNLQMDINYSIRNTTCTVLRNVAMRIMITQPLGLYVGEISIDLDGEELSRDYFEINVVNNGVTQVDITMGSMRPNTTVLVNVSVPICGEITNRSYDMMICSSLINGNIVTQTINNINEIMISQPMAIGNGEGTIFDCEDFTPNLRIATPNVRIPTPRVK